MLAAAFLMVVTALSRIPDFNVMQRDLAELSGKVNELRGTAVRDGYHFKQGGGLSHSIVVAHTMEGLCQGGGNPNITNRLGVLVGGLRVSKQRLDQIDDYAARLSRMLTAFQNPFK